MNTKEFDDIINEALEGETRKLIEEQIDKTDHLIDSVKNFQSLSGMVDKISGIESMGSGIEISVNGVTPEELVSCCGGDSLGKAQTNLMQSLHHDLEESGIGGTYDIDINTDGDENSLDLFIKISPNDDELSSENEIDMNEVTDNGELTNTFGQAMYEEPKDTNPTAEDDKDLILGDEVEVDEQWQAVAGAVAGDAIAGEVLGGAVPAAVEKYAAGAIGSKISDALGGGEEVDECNKELNKKPNKVNENKSGKKVITLSETEMAGLIEKIIREADDNPHLATPVRGVPGVDVTKKSHADSGKENEDALKAVEKKIKDFLSFDGNDDPEFPNQVGQGDQKVATKNTDSEDDVVDLNRGRNMADLTYDQEPGDPFKERVKLSLVGASEMGNAQTDEDGNGLGNVIPSKTGENIAKVADKRKEARVNEPIYDKEAVPVKEEPKKTDRPGPESGNAGDAVASEILRMKQMSKYKEKTQ